MEPISPNQKLDSGAYQETPESSRVEKSIPARVIRTMKIDAAEAIKNQNETTVSIAIAEEKKRAKEQADAQASKQNQAKNTSPAPKPIGRIFFIFIVLIIFALLGFAYVFLLPKLKTIKIPSIPIPSFVKPTPAPVATTSPVVIQLANSIVPAQSEKRFNITQQTQPQVSSQIRDELKKESTPLSIENLYFVENGRGGGSSEISGNRLLIFANAQAPEILTRSLDKQFMVGIFGETSGTSTAFVILKATENDTAVAGMLAWEASLPNFIDAIFGTSIEGEVVSTTKFKDVVVNGKDSRILTTAFGSTIAYAFANKTTILITTSKTALETLLPLAAAN